MSITSLAFLTFFACSCIVYYILPKAVRCLWLLACSYTFYICAALDILPVFLMMGMTALTYLVGLLLPRLPKDCKWLRCGVLGIAIVLAFLPLCYYKYCNAWFFAGGLIMPLGLSYFSLAAVGYLIDTYRGELPEKNFLYYALFVSFFPCITQGPIERARPFIAQLKNLTVQTFDYQKVTGGMFRVLWGFFKNLVVSAALLGLVQSVFSHVSTYSGPVLITAALVFSYALYCNFASCSDIAIGVGAMFGFTLTENFVRPLAASTFTDVWRRWHISLSSWLRDYVYFPLGGNRKGKLRAHSNQVIVFLVSGLWHGATWGYVIWGGLNGLCLCAGKETEKFRAKLDQKNPLYHFKPVRKIIKIIITYALFSACFVFFSADLYGGGVMDALRVFEGFFSGWQGWAPYASKMASLGFERGTVLFLCGCIALIEGFEYLHVPVNQLIRKIPIFLRWPLYLALMSAILLAGRFGAASNVYGGY